jgi:hypothetical protein
MAILNAKKGLGFIEVGVSVLKDTVPNKELAAKSRFGIKKKFAWFDQIRQKSRRSLSHQISAFSFFVSYSGNLASRLYSWTLDIIIHATHLQFKRKCPLLILPLLFQIS